MEYRYPIPDKNYIVLILCLTYNQEDFIEDALKGFVIQKTNFPFVALVVDDASSDCTAKIIHKYESKYPDIIKGVYLTENHYSINKSKAQYIKPWRDNCKYIALCEGDDYWIDPLKLQKQVDFLEANPEYGLVYSKAKVFVQNTKKFVGSFGEHVNCFEDLVIKNKHIPTQTALIDKDVYDAYQNLVKGNNWSMGDYPLWLYASIYSKIYFFDEELAVYRVLNNSASSRGDYEKRKKFIMSGYEISLFFAKLAKYDEIDKIDDNIFLHLFNQAYLYKKYNDGVYYYHKIRNKNIKQVIKYIYMKLMLVINL